MKYGKGDFIMWHCDNPEFGPPESIRPFGGWRVARAYDLNWNGELGWSFSYRYDGMVAGRTRAEAVLKFQIAHPAEKLRELVDSHRRKFEDNLAAV